MASAVVASLVLSALPAQANNLPAVTKVSTVAQFSQAAGETPEDVYSDHDGNLFVSLAVKGEIRRIAKDGTQSHYATLPIGTPLSACNGFLAIAGPLTFDFAGNMYVSVASCDLPKRGVWKVAPDGEQTQVARFPDGSFPNGIVYRFGKLYAADSNLATIFRMDPDDNVENGDEPEVWATDPLISRQIPGAGFPGANGIQVYADDFYVANSDRATIVKFPIKANGKAGKARVHATTPNGIDDFAFDLFGNIYGASFFDQIIRVKQNGQSEVVVQGGTLDGPTSVAFGRTWGDFLDIYVANASFPGFSAKNTPSVERYRVSLPGAPILGY
ncbi:MAG: hypothetical protein EOO75_00560 [Myxococcales bacterium]|nr:MAG: hypothetical protein EOO75_00560 [Myxococcales bacterium]